MLKYTFEIEILFFIDKKYTKKKNIVSVSAENLYKAKYKAIDNLKLELSKNENYYDCIKSDEIYFKVREIV